MNAKIKMPPNPRYGHVQILKTYLEVTVKQVVIRKLGFSAPDPQRRLFVQIDGRAKPTKGK